MFENARVAVVVPAYNEAHFIERTLRSIPAWVDHVIVIDDASRDATSERAASVGDARVLVETHAVNRGVGAAIATGYARAASLGADAIAVMAGDGQMDPGDLPALLRPIVRGSAAYVKGDRLSWPGAFSAMPWLRFVGNHVLSWLTRLVTGLRVRDSQCGYTAATRRCAEHLAGASLWPRYGYPNDALGKLALAGLRVEDVMVRPVYRDEESGIGWRHALFVIPYVLLGVAMRRMGTAWARDAGVARGLPHGR